MHLLTLRSGEFDIDSTVEGDGFAYVTGPLDSLWVEAKAVTRGLDAGSRASTVLSWVVPGEELALLGEAPQVSVLLDPMWWLVLDTCPNPERSARFAIQLAAQVGDTSIGTANDDRVIGSGDRLEVKVADRLGFGGPLPEGPPADLRVQLTLTCSVQPGSSVFQIDEESLCDLSSPNRFELLQLRVTATRAEYG